MKIPYPHNLTVNSDHISHCSGVSIVEFEQVNTGWQGYAMTGCILQLT